MTTTLKSWLLPLRSGTLSSSFAPSPNEPLRDAGAGLGAGADDALPYLREG